MFNRRNVLRAIAGGSATALLAASLFAVAQQTDRLSEPPMPQGMPPKPPKPSVPPVAGPGLLDPFVTWSGPDSAIKDAAFVRIATAQAWEKLWEQHSGAPLKRGNVGQAFIPQINFDKCIAIGIFVGEKTNSNGVVLDSIREEDGRVLLRFDESTYQTASGPNDGPDSGVKCRPYGIFVIPKTSLPITVEENQQGLKDQPPRWKERAKLE